MFILGLVFTHKNLYCTLETEPTRQDFGKDAVYRLLARSDIRWESLVPTMASGVITAISDLTSTERRNALIIDDTSYYRDRSKNVELLSRHC